MPVNLYRHYFNSLLVPTAFCNNCQSLVHYHNKRGKFLKDQQCNCGSSNLTAVSGKLNGDGSGWDYYDRKQNFVKHEPLVNVPRDTVNQFVHEQ